MRVVSILIIVAVMAGCENPAAPVMLHTEEVMERNVVVNPIDETLGYIYAGGQIFGLKAEAPRGAFAALPVTGEAGGTEVRFPVKDFLSKEGNLFFTVIDNYVEGEGEEAEIMVVEYHVKQENRIITMIQSLPDPPDAEVMTSGNFGPFVASVYDHQDAQYNKIIRSADGFLVSYSGGFDRIIKTGDGLLFAQELDSGRKSGIWYFADGQKAGPARLRDYARIW